MEKRIEVWYTSGNIKNQYYKTAGVRDWVDADTLAEAFKECKRLEKLGHSEIVVDVTFFDDDHDLIESKSRYYMYKSGKLKEIK